jgi:hypothetical protein
MDDHDFDTLNDLVERYGIDVFIDALRQVVEAQADEMLELGLNDKAKLMSLVAWNLRMFEGSAPRYNAATIEDGDMYPDDVDGLCLSCGIGKEYECGFCEQCLDLSNNARDEDQ